METSPCKDKNQDKGKDLTPKDQDKDKDLKSCTPEML